LKLQAVNDASTDQNFRQIERSFPIQRGDIAGEAVGSDQLEQPTIGGSVSAAGAIEAGSGFVAERTAVGRYKVTLFKELATSGVMVATPNRVSSAFATWLNAGGPSKTAFTVQTFGINLGAGTIENADSAFNFHIKAV
jgi:hypothetical protein